jgi:hypothetical protein
MVSFKCVAGSCDFQDEVEKKRESEENESRRRRRGTVHSEYGAVFIVTSIGETYDNGIRGNETEMDNWRLRDKNCMSQYSMRHTFSTTTDEQL